MRYEALTPKYHAPKWVLGLKNVLIFLLPIASVVVLFLILWFLFSLLNR